jgi:hypothetical protein
MLNLGKTVTLSGIGEITVRELSLESIVKLGPSLIVVLQAVTGVSSTGSRKTAKVDDGFEFLLKAIQEPALLEAVKEVAAASSNRQAREFDSMGLTDWLKWAEAFKSVTNWEELKELFTRLVPAGALAGIAGAFKGPTKTQ